MPSRSVCFSVCTDQQHFKAVSRSQCCCSPVKPVIIKFLHGHIATPQMVGMGLQSERQLQTSSWSYTETLRDTALQQGEKVHESKALQACSGQMRVSLIDYGDSVSDIVAAAQQTQESGCPNDIQVHVSAVSHVVSCCAHVSCISACMLYTLSCSHSKLFTQHSRSSCSSIPKPDNLAKVIATLMS